jgi:hypothetical protein
MEVQWQKTDDGRWWQWERLAPGQLEGHGVFVIWRNGSGAEVSAVLYVGRGSLREEFTRCRRTATFQNPGDLYVTWAAVDDLRMLDSIAAYLYRQLRPIWGEVVPVVPQMPINLPIRA